MSTPTADPGKAWESPGPTPLVRSTTVVGSMTLLSRISGLARDIVVAGFFGASQLMDAFVFAFKLPNLLRRFFAEGAFQQAFVPVIAESRATGSLEDTRALIARVAGTLAATLAVVTAVGVLAAPVLVLVFGTGLVAGGGEAALAVDMLRFTFPYIFFISLTAMAGAVLNTFGRFAIPAVTPVLLNLALIGAVVWLSPRLEQPILALAIGVFIAGVAQLAFQIPFLLRARLLPRPRLGFADQTVRRILKLMLPIMFGSSVAQINILFDTWIALFLAGGSATWLYYSDRLVEFPLGVFGIAIATVILPTLAAQHARESKDAFAATIDWALRSVILIGLPAAVALFVLAEPLFATIFYRGAFDETDVAMAAASLMAFAPGLLGFCLVKILVPGFYSRQDSMTPVRVGVRALLLGMVLNVVFVLGLLETGWAPPHVGLAAATTLSSLTNAALLFRHLVRSGAYRPGPGWLRLAFRIAVATLAMTLFLLGILALAGDWLAIGSWARMGWLAAAVTGGAAVYFATALAVGLRPAQFRLH